VDEKKKIFILLTGFIKMLGFLLIVKLVTRCLIHTHKKLRKQKGMGDI